MKTEIGYKIQVLDRQLCLLSCFTHERPSRTFAELLAETHLNKSTLYRLLQASMGHGLIRYSDAEGTYSLGLRLFEMGEVAVKGFDLRSIIHPVLENLSLETGENANLSILEDSHVVFLDQVASLQSVIIRTGIGRRLPAHCSGAGKALLAALPEGEAEDILASTDLVRLAPKTIVTIPELTREFRSIRRQGYAVDDEEVNDCTRCIGVPVRDHTGRAVAAISMSGPSSRITLSRISELAVAVTEAATTSSELLGYRESSQPTRLHAQPRLTRRSTRANAGGRALQEA